MSWIKRVPKVIPNEYDDPLEEIGKIRGIKDVDRFLNPTKNELFDPYLMSGIKDAGSRIINAINNGERILLSYDADADGLTSTSAMYRYLNNYTDNIDYIYNERSHGHGIFEQTRLDIINEDDMDEEGNIVNEDKKERFLLNSDNIRKIEESDLLIIVDSSSNDVDTCKHISQNLGVDIVILDHHAIEEDNPHVIMVNPQQPECEYPNKHLSGAGVVFKTIQVIEDMLEGRGKVDPFNFMDLVAVGTYADVMRVDIQENRFMIMHGLRNVRNTGLIRILKGGRVDLFKLDSSSIGFTIAPMLNGVARMGNIKLAIDILLEDDDNKCKPIRLKMQKLNEKRREIQRDTVNRYLPKVDENEKALIILDEHSSRGFNGLVAQQLSQQYKRPVMVGRMHKGTASGSFRSYNGFKFKSFLSDFGEGIEAMGHEGAGGFSLPESLLPELERYIKENLPSLDDIEPTIVYDIEIDVDDIHRYIKPMEQFNMVSGNGFPKIITRVNGIMIEQVDTLGKTKETRKFKTFDGLELIRFRVSEKYGEELGYFDSVDGVGQLQNNEWFNFSTREKIITPQIILDDYAKSVD